MERFLKVYERSITKSNKYMYVPSEIRFFPQIIIQGDYLKQFGFFSGDKIKVTLEQGKIIITKI